MAATQNHPCEADIVAFSLGRLSDREADAVAEHIAGCPECQKRGTEVTPDSFVELLVAARVQLDATPYPTLPVGELSTPPFPPTVAWDPANAPPAEAAGEAPPVPPELASHPKYRVLRWLGGGGMGSVWLAEHLVMRRRVAVKLIRPDLLARPGAADRFLREIRAVAQLHHANIVTAFDAEPLGTSCLLAMEYVSGKCLGHEVQRGPLPPAEACRAVRDAACGLAHAHAAGLVHRDVKPHNLMRATDGSVKVLDFGLAAVAAGAGLVTRPGTTAACGTPDYMAPEQIDDAGAADDRADIYGLGCTLYHLLAGRPPFVGGTLADKFAAHRTRTPDPVAGVPAGVSAIVARMMAKNPADRFQSATEVVTALEPFCPGVVRQERTRSPRASRRWAVVALALLAVAGLTAAGAAVYRFQTDTGELVIETTDDEIEVVVKQGGKVVTVFDPRTKQRVTLRSGEYEFEIDGQPAGLKLSLDNATLKRGDIVVAKITREKAPAAKPPEPKPAVVKPPFAKQPERLEPATASLKEVSSFPPHKHGWVTQLQLAPDGKTFVSIDAAGEVIVREYPSGKLKNRFSIKVPSYSLADISSDGSRLAIGGEKSATIYELNTGKEVQTFIEKTGRVRCAQFTSDGQRLLVCGLTAVRLWEIDTQKELWSFANNQEWFHHAIFSKDEATCFIASGGTNGTGPGRVRQLDTKQGRVLNTIDHPASTVGYLALSPDGTRLAGVRTKGVTVWEVATGKGVLELEHPGSAMQCAAFSRDGKWVLTNGDFGGLNLSQGLGVWDARTGRLQAEVHDKLNIYNLTQTPDGTILTGAYSDGTVRAWKFTPKPAEEIEPIGRWTGHAGIVLDVILTADGKRALSVDESGSLLVREYPGGKVLKAIKTDAAAFTSLAMSPDEKVVAIGCAKDTLKWFDLESGKEVGSAANPTGRVRGVAFTPDAKHVLAAGLTGAALWDRVTGKAIRTFDCAGLTCHWAALSPDGALALVAGGRADGSGHGGVGEVRIFETNTGKRVKALTGPEAAVAHATFSADGSRVVAACLDATARVWSLETGKEEFALRHTSGRWVQRAALTPDGRHLVTTYSYPAARQGTDYIVVWNLQTGKPLYSSDASFGGYSLALTADGRAALVGDYAGGGVRVYPLPQAPTDGPFQVTDFREVHGVDAAGLKKWVADLPRGFRPADITARAGATPARFDAVAVRDGHVAPFTLSAELGTVQYTNDFRTMSANGWSLQAVTTYPEGDAVLRHQLWVKDGRRWGGYWHPPRDLAAAAAQWRKDDLRPTGFNDTRGTLFGTVLGPADGLEWELHPSLTRAELLAKVQDARKRGWRIDALNGFGTGADRTYAITLVSNPTGAAWELKADMTATEYETAFSEQKKLGRRPLAVTSAAGTDVRYTAVWVEYTPSR